MVTWAAGLTVEKDSDAAIFYRFDWSDWLGASEIATETISISGPDGALTADNDTILSGNQKVQLRLNGGTPGRRYTVTCRIVTNESPSQTDDRSMTVAVKNL